MKYNPIQNITIEGPDLSGKTTLYNKIHNLTGYRWNIQDRSNLSMVIYAKMYERNTFNHIENLRRELYNLNNIMILLLPDWSVILKRFNSRGDEIQNLSSLKKLYMQFEEAAKEFANYPNVIVITREVDDMIVSELVKSLTSFERSSPTVMKSKILSMCAETKDHEIVGLNFTTYDSGSFKDINLDALSYEKEKEYYQRIKATLITKIKNELSGNNSKNVKENLTSRRFIYTSETCISLAHFLVRENTLDCKYFVRSSDVKNILYYDINFLKYLSKSVYDYLNLKNCNCRISVSINSAHIPNII